MADVDVPITRTQWTDERGYPTFWFYNFMKDLWVRTGGSSDAVETTQVTNNISSSITTGGTSGTTHRQETSSSYTVTGDFDHEIVICTNTASNSVTITMPTLYEGARVSVIRAGAGSVAISAGSDTIVGLSTQYLPLQYDAADMEGSTSEWLLT